MVLWTWVPTHLQKKKSCRDHGPVVMFMTLVGNWSQVLGTFATRTNIKGDLLLCQVPAHALLEFAEDYVFEFPCYTQLAEPF